MILLIRWLLLPISLIYQLIIWVRNLCYDKGLCKSLSFDIPTIVIGNLAIGGTGKSPMTEYLIRRLSHHYSIATLSRGYGRRTKGFRYVDTRSKAIEVGDEPLQFKRKFPHITVAVAEDRCAGIRKIQNDHDLVLLDDAYQHRRLQAGLSILLLEYQSLFKPIMMLPTGDFRDNFSAIRRADIVVITKCPDDIPAANRKSIEKMIGKYSAAPLFYTRIAYDRAIGMDGQPIQTPLEGADILLFCGIAKPKPLIAYLQGKGNKIRSIIYPDHHNFTEKDYRQIRFEYEKMHSRNKILLTTEKDFQRLDVTLFDPYPLGYIPITTTFLDAAEEDFDRIIRKYITASRL